MLGLNFWHVCLDILHILDLGITQHVCGSVLYLFVFDFGLGGNLNGRMERVWTELVEAYRGLGTPSREHSRSSKPTKFPELHSKGAVARHCVPALNNVLSTEQLGTAFVNDPDGQIYDMVKELLANLTTFYNALSFHGQWFDADASREAHQAMEAVGSYHQALCHKFMTQKGQLFRVTENGTLRTAHC